ncbi:MAG: adenylate/guanylate cyclase domain-containing protein [Spirochaetia bacterium]|nr:adenylate/guanylate cyclase domain-containing protein [Spirochaetia bacterium]
MKRGNPALDPSLRESLYFEILVSEKKRAGLLAGVFTGGFCFWLVGRLVFHETLDRIFGGHFPFVQIALVVGFLALYEMGVRRGISRALRLRKVLPRIFQYGNALLETSVPSLLIAVLAGSVEGTLAANSPIVMIYFVFIVLSVLRLNFGVGLFTGIVAAVGHFAACAYVLSSGPDATNHPLDVYLHSPLLWAGRSMVLLVSGALAGFVANELRLRLETSLQLGDERSRIVNMFGQYVSPAVVDKLLEQPSFEAEVRHVCVMFLDIRNFTSFSESRKPEEVILYLNTLFTHFIDVITKHNGIINKFLGDGFMAVFGAPLSDGRDVKNAVQASREIIALVENLNQTKAIEHTGIGIGLHAGNAVTGNVGSASRKEYTIIGDTVNLASRVEQLNKEFQSVLLVTDAVYDVVKEELPGEMLPPLQVKGRKESVQVVRLH